MYTHVVNGRNRKYQIPLNTCTYTEYRRTHTFTLTDTNTPQLLKTLGSIRDKVCNLQANYPNLLVEVGRVASADTVPRTFSPSSASLSPLCMVNRALVSFSATLPLHCITFICHAQSFIFTLQYYSCAP